MNFHELGLSAHHVSRIETLGLTTQTPIQAKAIGDMERLRKREERK